MIYILLYLHNYLTKIERNEEIITCRDFNRDDSTCRVL